jgi:putative ABC transport system ATP-binding protein
MISLRNITKYYSAGSLKTFVLRNITLDIREGEFVSIMGPSGSGKSTLLHILGMLDEANEGEYLFLDKPVHKLSEKQRGDLHKDSIGFVFQSYHLIDELNRQNIELKHC